MLLFSRPRDKRQHKDRRQKLVQIIYACSNIRGEIAMCQNWYAVIGQTFDVIGFLIIAFEWYHQYKRDHERRIGELQKAYERNAAERLGEPVPDQDEDKMMWR